MRNTMNSLLRALSSLLLDKERAKLSKPLRGNQPSGSRITILSVLRNSSDRDMMVEVSRRNQWDISFVSTTEEARESLRFAKPHIVLVDRDLDVTDWRHAVSSLAAASGGACVLLISRVIDDYLWNEVVANGGYDLLRKPLTEEDVVRNVKLAWSYWNGTRPTAAAAKK